MELQELFERLLEQKLLEKEESILRKSEIEEISKRYQKRAPLHLKEWDICWAAVGFEDDLDKYKIRPVIILDCGNYNSIKFLKCSSVPKSDKYKIKNYLTLGLEKTPYVNYKKVYSLDSKYIFEKLNKPLDREDIKNLSKLLIY